MGEARWPKRLLECQPTGRRKRGPPALIWQKYVRKAMDCWKRETRMIDGCGEGERQTREAG